MAGSRLKPFFRALRYVWPYRYPVLVAWLCAALVAALYFFSVGSVLPLFQVMFANEGVSLSTVRVADPADPSRQIDRPHLSVSESYRVLRAPPGSPVEVDAEARTVTVPEDCTVTTSGLRGFVESARGKPYYAAVAWAVGRLPEGRLAQLAVIMGLLVVLTAARGLLTYVNGWLVGFIACRSVLDIQERAFNRVLRLPLGYFQSGGGSEANSRLINDAFAVREGVQSVVGKVVLQPLKAVASLTLAVLCAVAIDWRILALVLVVGPVCAWLIHLFASRMRRVTRKALESAARILGILEETISALRVVKAYSMEGRERRRFFREARRYLRQGVKAFKIQAATNPALELIGTVAVAAAVVIGAYLLTSRLGGNHGLMTTFFAALVATMDPLRKMANVNNRLQAANNGAARLFELMDRTPESRSGTEGVELPRLQRALVFEDVHFRYDGGADDVLRGISLHIPAGETVAIVGRTGCGKTTLVNLIPRFDSPTAGRVTLDGRDIETVTLRSLRDQIGLVSQDIVLFGDTVANNIAYGSRPALRARGHAGRAARDEIVAAARMAHADEFIRELPDGYDTELGTLGQTLSGGQRQRLALARAIIRNPAILILDEATSALDEHTQSLVQDTLERFVRGRTVLVIAHRLSTIALARRIVVMEAGRIVDIGSHDELMARCDLYRALRETGLDAD